MSLSTKTKQSTTLVLIGDYGGNKADLLTLLHAALSGKTSKDFALMNDDKPTPDVAGQSPLYVINRPDGTTVNILDTPDLSSASVQGNTDAIKNAVGTLTTVDAFVVIADRTKDKLGEGVEPVLQMIRSTFLRPVEKNICFLFTSIDKGNLVTGYKQDNLPSWALKDQIIGPITNMTTIRATFRGRYPTSTAAEREELLEDFETPFERAVMRLNRLWKYVDQCSIQARDMKYLYRRSIAIESELYTVLTVDHNQPNQARDKGLRRIAPLVDEYCLLATSPDFLSHIKILLSFIHAGQQIPGAETSIGKLENILAMLETAKDDSSQPYPQVFAVC